MGAAGLSLWSIRVRYSSNGADVEGSCFEVSRVVIAIYIIFMAYIEQGPWMSVDDRRGRHCSVPVRDPNVGSVPGTDGQLPSRPNPG